MTKSKARIRGRIAKPGPAQELPGPADPLAWLVNRLQVDEDNQPLMQGIFSNYNDDITIDADENTLLGRVGPGRGPAQRLEIGDGLRVEDGVIYGEGGGEKGDPGPVGPPGPTGPPGPAGASSSMWLYRMDNGTAANDPGAGRYRYNNTTQSLTTKLYVDRLTQDGLDPTSLFILATFDDEFIIQERGLAAHFQKWRLLGPAINHADWFEVPVEFVSQNGSTFANNNEVTFILRTRGQPGPVGPQGPQGQEGPQGPRGPQGYTGVQGTQGPVGPIGPKGDKGDQGQQGIVGPVGQTGPQGEKGETGNVGPKGDKGDQGDIGPTGNTGATGPQGVQGPKGDPGSLGSDEAPVDGKTYGRKNEAWAEVESGSSIFVSDGPPLSAPDNALWWDSDLGILYLRYNDGTSTQWVQAAATGGNFLPVEGGTLTGFLTLHADPTAALHASTKQYVDNKVAAVPAPVAATAAEFFANSAPTKMLTSGAVWPATTPRNVSDASASIAIDMSLSFDFYVSMSGGGRNMLNPTNTKNGQKGVIYFAQDATGGRSISVWGTMWKFANGIKPQLTAAPNAIDTLTYAVLSNTFVVCSFNADFK